MIPAAVAAALEPLIGRLAGAKAAGGGSINDAYVLQADTARWFLKLNRADRLEMFTAEAAGLEALAGAQALRVPQPRDFGVAGHYAYLLLEYLELGAGSDAAAAALGQGLAAQHRVTRERFGWDRDNTIGSTPQPNAWCEDWPAFWAERRLGFQLSLVAKTAGHARLLERGAALLAGLPALFADHEPAASLLHGDLWGGNWGVSAAGEPVIFDPAVYFGDREADLAMTRLFGGFPPAFYAAYEAAWPLPPGHEKRCELYKLYHVLNHLNLFGSAYAGQAMALMDHLLD